MDGRRPAGPCSTFIVSDDAGLFQQTQETPRHLEGAVLTEDAVAVAATGGTVAPVLASMV